MILHEFSNCLLIIYLRAFTVIMGINIILKTQFKQFGLSDQYYIY